MKWHILILLLFLFACVKQELPPPPPAPGGDASFGKAVGGIQISNSSLPAWANSIIYTDIDPASVKEGAELTITVEKPSSVSTKFYIYANMYFLNKKAGVWEKIQPDLNKSGKIVQQWVENKAVFTLKADPARFVLGNNFVIAYSCIDTDTRDSNGNKIWNCNGKKWGLGAFEMKSAGYPELLEKDISTTKYKTSTMQTTTEGTDYTAEYESSSGTKSSVKFTRFKDYAQVKKSMSQNIAYLESAYSLKGNVCGFLIPGASATYVWFSKEGRVTIQTATNTIDDLLVNAYSEKYSSNCQILDELKRTQTGATGYCGNTVLDGPEQCDKTSDALCPGLCKPDCTCSFAGSISTGTCGDFLIQKPNSVGTVENCEPPLKRHPVTGQVVSGSTCFVKDPISQVIKSEGYCNEQCGCVSGIIQLPKCGNGVCEAEETNSTCGSDCPLDTLPPVITVTSPLDRMSYSANVTYSLLALDLSSILKCEASTDDGAKELLAGTGLNYTLMKSLLAGTHTVTFICTDKSGQTGNVTRTFGVGTGPLSPSINTKEILIQNSSFVLQTLTIKVGENVTWTNKDAIAHSAVSVSGPGIFDTTTLQQNQSKTFMFTVPGNYTYTCGIHPGMNGTIIVSQ